MTTNHMHNKVYSQAITAYQKNQDVTMTPLEIVVEIYKILMENLISARLCISEKKIEQMFHHQKKCINVLSVLASHLDFDAAPEQSEFLDTMYKKLIIRLTNVLLQPDPVAEYTKIIDFLDPIYKRWQEFAKEDRSKKAGTAEAHARNIHNAATIPPQSQTSVGASSITA